MWQHQDEQKLKPYSSSQHLYMISVWNSTKPTWAQRRHGPSFQLPGSCFWSPPSWQLALHLSSKMKKTLVEGKRNKKSHSLSSSGSAAKGVLCFTLLILAGLGVMTESATHALIFYYHSKQESIPDVIHVNSIFWLDFPSQAFFRTFWLSHVGYSDTGRVLGSFFKCVYCTAVCRHTALFPPASPEGARTRNVSFIGDARFSPSWHITF